MRDSPSACTATSSRSRARSRSRSSSEPGRSTISRRPVRTASVRSPRATSPACCCPRARSFSVGRCRRRARSSTRVRPSRSPRTSTPAVRSPRACRSCSRSPRRSSASRPAEALGAVTVNAAHVLGRADRVGRIAPGFDADLVLVDASGLAPPRLPPRGRRRQDGRPRAARSPGAARHTRPRWRRRKQRRRREKEQRHEYEVVYVDDEGNEVEVEPDESSRSKRETRRDKAERQAGVAPGRGGRTIRAAVVAPVRAPHVDRRADLLRVPADRREEARHRVRRGGSLLGALRAVQLRHRHDHATAPS